MKVMMRIIIPTFLLAFLASACAGDPVELVDIDRRAPVNDDQELVGNAPINAPFDADDSPVAIVPISVNTPVPVMPAVVEATVLNVREGPDTSFPIISSVKQGESLEVLGQYRSCDWLRVNTRSGERGWVKSGPGFANYEGDCLFVPSGPFRPLNGTLVYDRRWDYGPGTLTVENMTLSDGVVVLTTVTHDPLVGFYVRSMEQFMLTGFRDGNYLLYFSYGQAWDGNNNRFMVVEAIKKMDQELEFYSDETGYTTWTLSLNSLGSGMGSASASDIPASAFPGLN
jgi:hypothetical protein